MNLYAQKSMTKPMLSLGPTYSNNKLYTVYWKTNPLYFREFNLYKY